MNTMCYKCPKELCKSNNILNDIKMYKHLNYLGKVFLEIPPHTIVAPCGSKIHTTFSIRHLNGDTVNKCNTLKETIDYTINNLETSLEDYLKLSKIKSKLQGNLQEVS